MPEVLTAIDSVTSRDTSKGPIYEVKAGGEKFVTWKDEIAAQARALQGLAALVSYTESPAKNPAYPPDRYLDSVTADPNRLPPAGNGAAKDVYATVPGTGPSLDLDSRITRTALAKEAVSAMIAASDKTPQTINAILDVLTAWSLRGESFPG